MQLPWLDPRSIGGGLSEGLGTLGDAFTQAAQMKQQRDQQAAEMLLRQKQTDVENRRMAGEEGRQKVAADRETRLSKEQEATDYANGLKLIRHHLTKVDQLGRPNPEYDPDYAIGLAKIHGIDLKQMQNDQATVQQQPPPGAAPPAAPATAQPPLAGPPPMQPSNDPEAEARPVPPGAPSPVQPPPMGAPQPAPHQELGQHLLAAPQRAQQAAAEVDKLKGARQQIQASQYPQFEGVGPNGEKMHFDSGAGMESLKGEREDLATAGMTAADQMSPPLGKKVRDLVPLVRAGLMKPDDFRAALTALAGQDNQAAIAQGHDTSRVEAAKLRAKKGAGLGGGTGFNPKLEKINETELQHIGSATETFRKAGLDKSIAAYKELQRGEHELNSTNNPTTQIGVIDRLVRSNTGGKATMQSIKLQLEHMGGLDAQLQGWLEGKETGRLGDKQIANLRAAVTAAKASALSEISDDHQSFVGTHFSGSDYNQKGNWEKAHQTLFGSITDDKGKPIFQTEYDPNAPTIVRGSGRKSTATVGVNAKAGAADPLSTAAKVSKLPPSDQALATQALSLKPGAEHYDSAQKWLEVHGLK